VSFPSSGWISVGMREEVVDLHKYVCVVVRYPHRAEAEYVALASVVRLHWLEIVYFTWLSMTSVVPGCILHSTILRPFPSLRDSNALTHTLNECVRTSDG
jgi:hypothetical protein